MKNLFTFLFFFFLAHFQVFTQNLPPERAVDWKLAGKKTFFPFPNETFNVSDFGLIGDGKTPNDLALKELLKWNNEQPIIVFFPKGKYLFREPITIPSNCLLKGESPDKTELLFYTHNTPSLIQALGKWDNLQTEITENAYQGAQEIWVKDSKGFENGQFIQLFFNDKEYVTSEWARYSVGQIVKIKKVQKNRILLESPLRLSYSVKHRPQIQKLQMLQNVGIESLKISRFGGSSKCRAGNISFQYVANGWIKNVESERCAYSHVDLSYCSNVTIMDSYFHEADEYGNGGKGYGVAVQFTSGECLIENNIFQHLRHSMLVQAGANGNVFAYNYSREPFWTEVKLPANAAGDIVLHGNYPYANLFEGNVVQSIVIDKSHGKNGGNNTFLRNRAELYGIFMTDKSAPQNFIANEIPNKKLFYGNFFLMGKDNLSWGNIIKGRTQLAKNTTEPNFVSLYYAKQPTFLHTYSFDFKVLPAKQRFETKCLAFQ